MDALKNAIWNCNLRDVETYLLIENGVARLSQDDLDALLFDAVHIGFGEGIALLLLLGANPQTPVNGRDRLSAFGMAWTHFHAQQRPRYGYFMRLLEHRPPQPDVRYYHDRVGRDVDAPLDGVGENGLGDDAAQLARMETAVHFALQRDYLYGLLWLVDRRGARLDLKDAEGRNAIGEAMRSVETINLDTRLGARACFVLLELLIRRYAQDPRPYADAFPEAMQVVRHFAAAPTILRPRSSSLRRRAIEPSPYEDEYARLSVCLRRLIANGALCFDE
jgi:hypothetical protein